MAAILFRPQCVNVIHAAFTLQDLEVSRIQVCGCRSAHDDVMTWKCFPTLLAYCVRNQLVNSISDDILMCYFDHSIVIPIHISMVSCQNGPTPHAYAWQIGPFWQDTIDM